MSWELADNVLETKDYEILDTYFAQAEEHGKNWKELECNQETVKAHFSCTRLHPKHIWINFFRTQLCNKFKNPNLYLKFLRYTKKKNKESEFSFIKTSVHNQSKNTNQFLAYAEYLF